MSAKKALPLHLFWSFFQFGFYTFGGGWSLIAQIQKKFVEEEKLLSEEEMLDVISIGRSLPGLLTGNTCYLFGYQVGGFACAIACVIGISLPPVIFLTVLTWFYERLRSQPLVESMLLGVRAAVAPIILSGTLRLRKAAFKLRSGYVFFALALAAYIFGLDCILIIAAAAVAGLLLYRKKEG